jgi:ATPase
MRNTEDFMLFTDMRLSGVGMIGVVHGTNPVDSIQRFIGRIELGVIPQIIDTVLFIRDGEIAKVLSLDMEVKVPSGMTEADLARPVVVVKDFETNKLEYEIYTYGEQTVVIPVQGGTAQNPAQALAAREIERFFSQYADEISVEMVSNNRCNVFVPQSMVPEIIGKGGKNIENIEKKLGISLNIEALGKPAKRGKDKQPVDFGFNIKKNSINLLLDPALSHQDVDVVLDGDFLLTAKISKRGIVKVKKNNKIGKILMNALNAGENVELRV